VKLNELKDSIKTDSVKPCFFPPGSVTRYNGPRESFPSPVAPYGWTRNSAGVWVEASDPDGMWD